MNRFFDTKQLVAFTTLAKTGSFTQTAKQLFLTQSAISHSLKALERDLNCTLFTRVGKKVHLTLAGEQLFESAEKILAAMAEARTQLESITEWGRGRLRVAASVSACQYMLPAVLREFRECFHDCEITFESSESHDIVESIRGNRTDIGLIIEPSDKLTDCVFEPLFEDEVCFLLPPNHPWLRKREPAGQQSFRDESIILFSKTSYTAKLVAQYFKSQSLEIRNTMEPGSLEALKEMVKIGMGAGIASPWIAEKELAEGSLVSLPLGKRPLKRQWGFCYLRKKRLTLAEETFLGLCRTAVQNLALRHRSLHPVQSQRLTA